MDFPTKKDIGICRKMSKQKEDEIFFAFCARNETLKQGKSCYIIGISRNIHGRTGEGKEPIELGLSIRRREKFYDRKSN